MRVCLPQLPQTIATLETLMPASFSMIPPLIFLDGLGRVWRLMMLACSTSTVFFRALTANTLPLLPASRPDITFTWSPLRSKMVCRLICCALMCLPDFRSQRDDLGELLLAQLSCHRTENTGSDGLIGIVNQNCGVVVKANVSAILAARFFTHSDHHALHYRSGFH